VVTYEFENVPAAAVEALQAWASTWRRAQALAVAQDRVAEKTFLNANGAPTSGLEAADKPVSRR
jgi:5-(carboxyamino)imidazole ribonucleotide synthase